MTIAQATTFDKIIDSVYSLPKVSQDFIAHEVKQKISDLNTSLLTKDQEKIVKERMSTKREYATPKQVQDLFQSYSA